MKELDPHIRQIFQKYLVGNHTAQELDELLVYFGLPEESEYLKELIEQQFEKEKPSHIDEEELNDMVAEMEVNIQKAINKPVKTNRFKWWYAAASILLISLIGTFAYISYKDQGLSNQIVSQYGSDVLPGSNKATLILADGSKIELDNNTEGIEVKDQTIVYKNGAVVSENKSVSTAVLQVPNSGIYRLTLSDGTKVVLNSGSSLSYPLHFSDSVRLVNLQGEGYFEVSPDKTKPFRVQSSGQTLTVLGTHFNIQSYTGEPIQTTLLQGKVSLSSNGGMTFLAPGQQAIIQNNKYQVHKVNAQEAIAWANNLFIFNHIPLNKIFKSLERWYDVDINYPSTLTNETYLMEIPKDRKLSEILSSISDLTGIKFKIEGRRVTATTK